MFEVYKEKKVLVTGHTGFKGSWLTQWLIKLGADVCGISNEDFPHFLDLNLHAQLGEKDFEGNITFSTDTERVFKNYKPEIVFHLAAQPIVRKSYEDPYDTFNTNTIGTLNLCEAMRKYPPKVFIAITTDKVYADQKWDYSYRENDILAGYDPYACSKVCAEHIITSYRDCFLQDTLVAKARAGNVIGGGDWGEDRLIPDLMRAYKTQKLFNLRNPHHVRPWQYVLDCLSGYLMLGEKLLQGKFEYEGAWNFGPSTDSCITTQKLVNLCVDYWPELKSICHHSGMEFDAPKQDFHETKVLMLDSTKAQTKLGWKPKFDIQHSVWKTIEWYQHYFKGDIITKKHIEDYEKL